LVRGRGLRFATQTAAGVALRNPLHSRDEMNPRTTKRARCLRENGVFAMPACPQAAATP